jgi:hypothetical protein
LWGFVVFSVIIDSFFLTDSLFLLLSLCIIDRLTQHDSSTPSLKGSRNLQRTFTASSFSADSGPRIINIRIPTFRPSASSITGSGSSTGSAASDGTINTVTNGTATVNSLGGFEGMGRGSAASSSAGADGNAAGDAVGAVSGTTAGVIAPMMTVGISATTFESDSTATGAGRFVAAGGGDVIGGGGAGAGTFTVSSTTTGLGVTNGITTATAMTLGGGQGVGTNIFGAAGGLASGVSSGSSSGIGNSDNAQGNFVGTGGAMGNFNDVGVASFGNGDTISASDFGNDAGVATVGTPGLADAFGTISSNAAIGLNQLP